MKLPLCGTRSGYMAHKRQGETACDPCREANAIYSRKLRGRPRKVPAHERIVDLLETYCGEWLSADQIALMLGIGRSTVGHALGRMPSWRFEIRSNPIEQGRGLQSERREYRVRVRSYL
jgi:biotin operon repressor